MGDIRAMNIKEDELQNGSSEEVLFVNAFNRLMKTWMEVPHGEI